MQVNKRCQCGFAALESLLIVIILAIIGGMGYFVWHSRQTNTASTKQEAISRSATKYVNPKLGFQFSYPSSWGNVQLSPRGNKVKGYNVSFIAKEGTANQYLIAINDTGLQTEMADDIFSSIADYNLANDKLMLIMVDGSAQSDFTVLKSRDGIVLFTGGQYSDYVAGIKNVNYITGMKKASVMVADGLDRNSSEVQQNILRLLQSFKPAEK